MIDPGVLPVGALSPRCAHTTTTAAPLLEPQVEIHQVAPANRFENIHRPREGHPTTGKLLTRHHPRAALVRCPHQALRSWTTRAWIQSATQHWSKSAHAGRLHAARHVGPPPTASSVLRLPTRRRGTMGTSRLGDPRVQAALPPTSTPATATGLNCVSGHSHSLCITTAVCMHTIKWLMLQALDQRERR